MTIKELAEQSIYIEYTYKVTQDVYYNFQRCSNDFTFEMNFFPTVKITQVAIEAMKKIKFGRIINIITEAMIGLPPMGYSLNVCNKAYLMELTNVWNKEYTRYNIASNCTLPAYKQTKFIEVDERIHEQILMERPMKKLLTVEKVAYAVKLFFDVSQEVNGVKLPINAGTMLMT